MEKDEDPMSKRTADEKASHTAGYTCFSRACATRERNERFRGPDDMAEIFLPAFAKIILNVPVLRKAFMGRIAPSGIYEYVIARTKVLDAFFVAALEKKLCQIVILGAGMDTRAFRFASMNQGTKIIELDIEKTQNPKIEILNRKRVTLPGELIFAPIDFNQQSLSDVLITAGFQKGQQSLFLWEGVTMYLDADAVDRTLAFIKENSQAGTQVVFDYIFASVLRQEHKFYGEKEIFDTVSRAGEEWTFGIEAGEIDAYLTARGFKSGSHYTPAELEGKYFKDQDGKILRRINGTHCIVQAVVA
jgi:methyltransferase (TIGR00027 family)